MSSLQKLEDAKDFDSRKKGAIGGKADKGKSESVGGYSLVHLLIVALLSLIIGAIITKSTKFEDSAIKSPQETISEPDQVVTKEAEPEAEPEAVVDTPPQDETAGGDL